MVLLTWSGDWTQTASLSMFISTSICVKTKPYKTLTCAALSFTSQGFCPVFFSAQDHCIEHVASQKTIWLTDPGPLSSHNHTQSQMCELKMMDGWHSHSPGKRQWDWKSAREKVEAAETKQRFVAFVRITVKRRQIWPLCSQWLSSINSRYN